MSKLVLYLPDGTTLDIPLDRERMTIGRRADNEVCLPNLAVSGEHAVVVTILADSFLEDLGSTNGTLVNGKAIAKHFLRDRDEIDIGKHKLVYCTDDEVKLEPAVTRGMARVRDRDSGGRVEMVKARGLEEAEIQSIREASVARSATGNSPLSATIAGPLVTPAQPTTSSEQPIASIRILSGLSAGISMPLTKTETTIGRPGVQVAAVVKSGDEFLIKAIEGERAPTVNGRAVSSEGMPLAPGDRIDIAGTSLEFVVPNAAKVAFDTSGSGS